MILQSLNALYERLRGDAAYRIAPAGYSAQKIAFKVVLRPSGQLFEIQDARVPGEKGVRPRRLLMPGLGKPPGSGISPCFLWDNSGYMLGYKPEDDDPERTLRSFDAFRERHLALEDQIQSEAFSLVCRFLESWDPAVASQHAVLEEMKSGFGVFQLQAEASFVHEDPAVVRWWQEYGLPTESRRHVVTGKCLVTGQIAPIARTHPKIKGVRDAQSSGATIAGFNERAFWSYGKEQSFNAPVSEDVAFRYTTAINALLEGRNREKHRLTLGDATVAFWTDRPTATEDVFAQFAAEGSASLEAEAVQDEGLRQKLEAFLHALRKGQEAYADLEEEPHATSFYLLGLSPNAARISIRFFYRGTLSELVTNLRRHYADTRIRGRPATKSRRGDPEFPPMRMLLRETARESKDVPPILAGPLLRAIITGARYPIGLFAAVMRRIHADRNVRYARVCVIKGYLTRNRQKEVTMSLDTERTDPSYLLGRLFAALEKTQRDALGESLNATIRDRFYGAASATPRTVFPRLLRTYQHHLAKLENVGQKVNREKLVQAILGPLDSFPAHLGLDDQGLFAIGYYHQTQDFYTKKETNA